MAEATATEEQAPPQEAAEGAGEGAEVHEAELPQADAAQPAGPGGQIDVLLDTKLEVSVRLGQVEMPARDLIRLGPGSVLTLDRKAGEPVELLLRGTPFAQGKLVVVGEQLGVRIEQVLAARKEQGEGDEAA